MNKTVLTFILTSAFSIRFNQNLQVFAGVTSKSCRPLNHVDHLRVDMNCRKMVLGLLESRSEEQDVQLCVYMSSVCVSTVHDYFSRVRVERSCLNSVMEIAVRKLSTCRDYVGFLTEEDVGIQSI